MNKTLEEMRKDADESNAEAQNNLGEIYRDGKGVSQDDKEAIKWFKDSANQRFIAAQNNLAWMHKNGEGVRQGLQRDDKEAVKWFARSQGE